MLTEEQRAALEAAAESEGVDAAELIAEAEALTADKPDDAKTPGASAKGDKPNLYLYHLSFVTVNEVRTIWLDLPPVAGGEEWAAAWAAKQAGTAKPPAAE